MDNLTGKLQSLLDDAAAEGDLAGANLLVLQNGRERAYAQTGFADIEKSAPYRRDTIFRAYSMTKPITAAGAMVLMEQGKLDLGQSVGDILPAFRDLQVWENGKKVPARRCLMVRDLLNMTSGLSYPGDDPAGREAAAVFARLDGRLCGPEPMTTQELAAALAGCGLAFQPGERWMYGTSADVLGAVLETVSGRTLGEFLKECIFEPLGMADTGFYVPAEKRSRLAQVYEKTAQGPALFRTDHLGIRYPQDVPPAFESGGAGLATTLDDYARFARMLLSGGTLDGARVLRPGTVKFFTRGRLLPWQQTALWQSWESMCGYGYGNLMRVLEEPGMAVVNGWPGEYGWDGWLGSYFCNCPGENITILMSAQRRDAGTMPITRKLRNVIASEL